MANSMSRELTPEWLEAYGLEESELDQAYTSLDQTARARLKKTIAQLFEFYSQYSVQERRCETHWSAGMVTVQRLRPVPWTLTVLAPEIDSPAQLLAAALPPLSLGVECCLVVRAAAGSPWPPSLICAMELAGLERMYSLPREHLPSLVDYLDRVSPWGTVLCLGEVTPLGAHNCKPRSITLDPPRSVGLWYEESVFWDEAALRFAHPSLELLRHGPGAPPPASGREAPAADWNAFVSRDAEGLFVPPRLIPSAMDHQRLVLGPGQEACWVWPQLTREVFLQRRLAWYEQADWP